VILRPVPTVACAGATTGGGLGVIRRAHCARDLKNRQPCNNIMLELRLIAQKKASPSTMVVNGTNNRGLSYAPAKGQEGILTGAVQCHGLDIRAG
jgi:hypothetical protein